MEGKTEDGRHNSRGSLICGAWGLKVIIPEISEVEVYITRRWRAAELLYVGKRGGGV